MEKEVEVPGKKNVFLILILTVITLGIYPFIWYLRRTNELNNLKTKSNLKKSTTSIAFFIIIVILVLCIVLGVFTVSTYSEFANDFSKIPLPFLINLGLILLFGIILFMMILFFAFRTRRIINQALVAKGSRARVSWFFTLIFNFYYLQYEINRVIDDKEETRKVWPWVILLFIILLIGLIVFMIYSFYQALNSINFFNI